MMPPGPLFEYAQERAESLRHEAYSWHLVREDRPRLRLRLALVLKALAERLEPELRHSPGRRERNTPFLF
jgi:hypothetical protein